MTRLSEAAPALEEVLMRRAQVPARFPVSAIRCETIPVTMRDGIRLATDIYLPPLLPAPAMVMRSCYGREIDGFVGTYVGLARRGFVVVSQDCRGTGESEPDIWDYYVYEAEDGLDLVDWITRQEWYDDFIGSFGGSYLGQTQWCMAMHPKMSAILPEVSGLGIAFDTVHKHMHRKAFSLSHGKGRDKSSAAGSDVVRRLLPEDLAAGYFNEPLNPAQQQRLSWERYCGLTAAGRAEFIRSALDAPRVTNLEIDRMTSVFGQWISHDAFTFPHHDHAELVRSLKAPALMVTGWYDWCLNDALATWQSIREKALEPVRSSSRLIVTPSAHQAPGYLEGMEDHPELRQVFSAATNVALLTQWAQFARVGDPDAWPRVVYYLMGANEWRWAEEWPVPGRRASQLYLGRNGVLTDAPPETHSLPDRYTYDPLDPTPTVGGSIVSPIYPTGGADISSVHGRSDVLVYTTEPLARHLGVVGPLRLVLYASSTAVDTDLSARLSDVFPDGRAIHVQSGILRARYRDIERGPELLEPGVVYRFEIDMWATANRFKRGHRLRLDISSADFPRFDRNSNLGGQPGAPVKATQTIYHDPERPSRLVLYELPE